MKPKLTVVVPTLNRPELAKIAVDSILNQNGEYCCEIIISNNGANIKTRELFNSGFYKDKIIYLETKNVLSMPMHWEWATGFATGEYLMVLPDRRLLKQGAIKQLISSMDSNPDCEACCCCDEWLYKSGRLETTKTFMSDTKFSTENILKRFEAGLVDRNSLPLGLNCVLRNSFLIEYRGVHGRYFDSISPDFRSAFNFLFNANNVYVISEPLIITTGFKLSNGGEAYKGDSSYLNSLGTSGQFIFLPRCFEGNVWGSIYEDYLRSKFLFKMNGDYKSIMSKFAMTSIMTEQMIKVVASNFNHNSRDHYRAVRKVLKMCGWDIIDDLKTMRSVFAGLRQFLPEPLKRIYRSFYALTKIDKARDVLQVAGF